ncbi:MAG: DUF6985 domain-containing protein [Candidatus Cyclobacteriaceae bacterium M2_1C_046]
MKNLVFKFNGDWEFELKLDKFKVLNNSEYTRGSNKPSEGLFMVEIFDERNSNPDPEIYQINTINFLLDMGNQTKILKSLLKYSKETIYPHYKISVRESEYPECYPKLDDVESLNKLYGINRIIIKRIDYKDFAYYIFDCNTCLDYEHGIKITFYKDTVIDHGEDWEDEKVCEHKGIDYESYQKKAVKDYNQRNLILTEPHPKYGKLKPWQSDQNQYYPYGLFHAKKDNELIKAFETGIIPKEPIASRILGMAIREEREFLTQYFIKQNPEYKYTAFMNALNKDRFDLTEVLLEQNYDLNEKVAQSSFFYETINNLVKAISNGDEINKIKKRLKYLLNNGLNPYLEDKFNRNSFFRIRRIDDENLKDLVTKEVMSIVKAN